jgi:hypothetical protein
MKLLCVLLLFLTTADRNVDGSNSSLLPTTSGIPGATAVAPNCTAIGEQTAGGDVFFGGCPTNACDGGAGTSPCQPQWNVPQTSVYCYCLNGPGVACKATVATAPGGGGVLGWSCKNLGCAVACTQIAAPLPVGRFYFCFC